MTEFKINLKGFTPVIDKVVDELGLMPAVVFGVAWRYCQMEDRVCKASHERIAARVGVSRRTVLRHLGALCDAGYLVDLTPDLRNKPHTYADTGRAKITGEVEARVSELSTGETGSHTNAGIQCDRKSHLGVTESHSHCDRESLEETDKIQTRNMGGGGESLDLLIGAGVSPDMARQLALTCDPDLVASWVSYVTQQSGLTNPAGLVVARLRAGDPVPWVPTDTAPTDQVEVCEKCGWRLDWCKCDQPAAVIIGRCPRCCADVTDRDNRCPGCKEWLDRLPALLPVDDGQEV